MIAPLKLRDREIPLLPLGAVDRLALHNSLIDCSDRPAAAPFVCFAAIGMALERVAKAEERVPVGQRSIPPALAWKPLAKCDRDIYAYGAGICEAFEAAGEDIMAIMRQGDAIAGEAFRSLQPPKEAVEAELGNSAPAAVGSPTSAGSPTLDLAATP